MSMEALAGRLAEKHNLSDRLARAILRDVVQAVVDELKTGSPVQLRGLGSLACVDRETRQARNPLTGESITIPAHRAVRFRMSKDLRTAVNGG